MDEQYDICNPRHPNYDIRQAARPVLSLSSHPGDYWDIHHEELYELNRSADAAFRNFYHPQRDIHHEELYEYDICNWAAATAGGGGAHLQRSRFPVPLVNYPYTGFLVAVPPPPQSHSYHYPYTAAWFPPRPIDASSHTDQQIVDGHLIIDLPTAWFPPRPIDASNHTDQQIVDDHLIIDLPDQLSGRTAREDLATNHLLAWPEEFAHGDQFPHVPRTNGSREEDIDNYLKTRRVRKDDRVENNICVVCQDDLYDKENIDDVKWISALNCGHEYHTKCITSWLQQKLVCPLCNAVALPQR
ncbi:hypothetical protein F511_22351 [Dorcoceras hygrometricum]|uniref:RING-type E3 ubiquitin transferase n=1 Tax=Dorcoceras hygrometricum TaxID=472368 RepID=A0A2Z7D9Y0_9LAMI|nr:hypothetical protein F511_22351 [Dorcoceras hygrometricum]